MDDAAPDCHWIPATVMVFVFVPAGTTAVMKLDTGPLTPLTLKASKYVPGRILPPVFAVDACKGTRGALPSFGWTFTGNAPDIVSWAG
jgi:hypothetical protein